MRAAVLPMDPTSRFSLPGEDFGALPMPSLVLNDEVLKATEAVWDKLKNVISRADFLLQAPTIKAILDLKKQRNAVILAHNYQTPEIFHGVADVVGDSLQLALEAKHVQADVIVMCGVHFMAETAKILNPNKTVLIPDAKAGCSLADSITAEDILLLKHRFPGVPVVTYVNTSAAVKAVSDVCCTSSNALKVVESLPNDTVLFLPDQHLANWVAGQTKKRIVSWEGACEVHERFTGDELRSFRERDPQIQIIAHPECPSDVLAEADFTGSTAKMIDWVKTHRPTRVLMVTECSMAANVAAEAPDIDFIKPCNLCPHMKRITLPKILQCLLDGRDTVHVDPDVAAQARQAVERMIAITA